MKINTQKENFISDFIKLGYSMSEATELAEVANIYTGFCDCVQGIEMATESLKYMMDTFDKI